MATKNKASEGRKAKSERRKAATDNRQPTTGSQQPPTIRKGVYLSALIYVEGDQPAPDDFTARAKTALRAALSSALSGEQDGLSMTLKKIETRTDVEQEGDGGGEEKFEF